MPEDIVPSSIKEYSALLVVGAILAYLLKYVKQILDAQPKEKEEIKAALHEAAEERKSLMDRLNILDDELQETRIALIKCEEQHKTAQAQIDLLKKEVDFLKQSRT